jgi:hypothetical protein
LRLASPTATAANTAQPPKKERALPPSFTAPSRWHENAFSFCIFISQQTTLFWLAPNNYRSFLAPRKDFATVLLTHKNEQLLLLVDSGTSG